MCVNTSDISSLNIVHTCIDQPVLDGYLLDQPLICHMGIAVPIRTDRNISVHIAHCGSKAGTIEIATMNQRAIYIENYVHECRPKEF